MKIPCLFFKKMKNVSEYFERFLIFLYKMMFFEKRKKLKNCANRESHGKLQIQHLHNSFTAGIFKVLQPESGRQSMAISDQWQPPPYPSQYYSSQSGVNFRVLIREPNYEKVITKKEVHQISIMKNHSKFNRFLVALV